MNPLRVLIVDDEPLARLGVRQLLAREPGTEIVGEAKDGREAVAAIGKLSPELVFLDVQMPRLDGFGVIAAVGAAHMPAVVFVTAFEEFAVRAFEVSALDYLLKPLDGARFAESLARVRRRLATTGHPGEAEVSHQLAALLAHVQGTSVLPRPDDPPAYLERMAVRASGERTVFLHTAEIGWIEAADYYVNLHVNPRQSYLVRESLSELERCLDPARWVRLHRSALVNLDHIQEVVSLGGEECEAVLRDGSRLRVSRRRVRTLEERLGRFK